MVVHANASGTRRFTRNEYTRMAAKGILRPDERVELIDGEIFVMSPQGSRHTTVVRLIARALEKAYGDGHDVRSQAPLVLDAYSEPEPDVAVVAGSPDDYLDEHPRSALIVVEVSDSSLALDRRKASLYAAAKIPEFWIANLIDGVLEVHRSPEESPNGEWSYTDVKRLKPTASVQPLGARKAKLKVSALLR